MIDIRQGEVFKGLLTNEEIWDIATALRGPDGCERVFKQLFTARIRWFALPEALRGELRENHGMFNGYVKVRTTPFVWKKSVDEAITLVADKPADTYTHYLEHIVAALDMMVRINTTTHSRVFGTTEELRFLKQLVGAIVDGDLSEITPRYRRYIKDNFVDY
jgi:hypothetical protein